MFLIIILLGILVLTLCAQGKLLSKSGENGWKILIPVYGGYLLYQAADAVGLFVANIVLSLLSSLVSALAGDESMITLLFAIPLLVINILFYVKLAKAYGKSGGFAVGLIFLPIIFLCILAFGDSEHVAYAASWRARNQASAQQAVSLWRCPSCGAAQASSRLSCTECGEKRP